nr:GNAT family N-acetyltransferase [uncultured Desulfobulbus sp.]
MDVEVATIEDAESIFALQKLAYVSEAVSYNDFEIDPLTQSLDALQRDFGNQVFLKASVSGKIIGSVRRYLAHGICHIGRLIVHPDFQNQGIGKLLMNLVESYFKNAKRYELVYWTQKRTQSLPLSETRISQVQDRARARES